MSEPQLQPPGHRPARASRGRSALVAAASVLAGVAALASIRGQVIGEVEPEFVPVPAAPRPDARADRAAWALATYRAECAGCHGAGGRVDRATCVYPGAGPVDLADLARPAEGADDRARRAIVEGVAGTPMARFGSRFDPAQVDALLDEIRTFAPGATAPLPAGLASKLEAAGFRPEARIKPAPAVDLEGIDGARVSLADTRGKLTVVVFWGSSCAPCLEEMPEVERLADAYRGRGVAVLPAATNVADAGSIRVAIMGRVKAMPVYFARSPALMDAYDLDSVPAAALIDRSGRLLGISRARTAWEGAEFRDLLEACLAADPPA